MPNPYLVSAVLLVAGIILLIVVAWRVRRATRLLRYVREDTRETFREKAGMLRARKAALRVAIGQRWGTGRT